MKELYEFGRFTLDVEERRLLRDGQPVSLKPKVLETLLVLVENGGHAMDKDELMKRLWPDSYVEEANLAVNISQLRKALGDKENGELYIETVPRRGYRFVAPVTKVLADRVDMVVHERRRARILVEEEETPDVIEGEPGLVRESDTEKELALVADPRRSSKVQAFLSGIRKYPKLSVAVLAIMIIFGAGAGFGIYKISNASRTRHFETIAMTRLANTRTPMVSAISPNGEFVAYAISEKGQASLWISQVASGSEVQIVSPASVFYGSIVFSHDGHNIYYSKQDRTKGNQADMVIYEIPAFGGVSKKVVAAVDESFSLSPDDNQIAFVRNNQKESSLFIARTDGTAERQLAVRKLPDQFERVAWSPIGDFLACSAFRRSDTNDRIFDLIEVRLDDGLERKIGSQGWNQIWGLTWLADGSGIVLAGMNQKMSPPQIWLVSYPNGELRRITNDLQKYYEVSVTANSGTMLARTSDNSSRIWIVPNGGRGAHNLIASRGGRYSDVSWTPDGRLVYVSPTKTGFDIWMMNSDGTDQKQLTSDTFSNDSPKVTRDGRHIFFSSSRENLINLWRIDVDGGNPKQLTSGKDNRGPQISPDGKWIVYVSKDSGVSNLWKIPTEGGKPEQLTEKGAKGPAVSPDGTMIACFYQVEPKSDQRLVILPFEGGEPLKVFDVRSSSSNFIRWTPDSQAVTYTYRDEDGMFSIWNQPVNGRAPEKLTDFGSDQIQTFDWSPDGKQLAVVKISFVGELSLIRNLR